MRRLALAPNATARTLTRDFDRSVGDFALGPDGRAYLTAEDEGFVRLYSVPVDGGAVTPVVDTRGSFAGLDVAEDAKPAVVITSWGSATEPNEVVRVDVAARRTQRLSDVNVEAAGRLDWAPLQEFWFTNGLGRRVHNFLATPQGFDPAKKYPLLVLIHGGHASMWRDQITLRWNYHLLASPGYVVLLTDYRGSTGYGERFTLDILKDPLKGPADDLNLAADEAVKRFPFVDASRQAAGGASYGGHLANWLEATTTRYKCLVSHAGLSSLETQWATSDSIRHREVMMGGPFWESPRDMAGPEPRGPRQGLQDSDPAVGGRERLPRADEQHARDVRGPAAPAGSDAPARLAGGEPLDPEAGGQPRLLPRGRRLAEALAAVTRGRQVP